MKCAVHTEVDAKGFCRNCGKGLCDACARDVRGIPYCEECLAGIIAAPQPATSVAPGSGNAALAAILGFVPGLGAVYNGEYLKALIHVLIFGAIIFFLNESNAEGVFVPLLIFFIFYQPVEAYRTAKAKAMGEKPTGPFSDMSTSPMVAPVFLIALGGLLLLANFEMINMDAIVRFWPLLLIVLGVWLLRKRFLTGTAN